MREGEREGAREESNRREKGDQKGEIVMSLKVWERAHCVSYLSNNPEASQDNNKRSSLFCSKKLSKIREDNRNGPTNTGQVGDTRVNRASSGNQEEREGPAKLTISR